MPGPPGLRPSLLRAASLLLALTALALFWLAFTQFGDAGPAPPPGSPTYRAYEQAMTHDAQVSVLLGLAGCFVLLGSFACHGQASKASASAPAEAAPGPQP
jgi:hypothetical protein